MSMPAEHIKAQSTLADLLQGYADAPPIPVRGISSDSRRLDEGDLFLAVQGSTSHGLDFLAEALEAEVCAVAWDSSTGTLPVAVNVPTIAVDNLAGRLGEIANRFYDYPSEHLGVIGVTGTNGKTTVAWMIAQAVDKLGQRCGYLGTLGYGMQTLHGAEGMTTPGVIEFQERLAGFVDQGADYAAVEVSSHALSQGRVDGVRFDTGIFTNLSRDHLDYHGDMAAYFASKARLFSEHAPRYRIVNIDCEYGARLASICGPDVVTVSTRAERGSDDTRFVIARSVVANDQGFDVAFVSSWGDGAFALQLPGDFNVDNAMSVLALLLVHGVPLEKACEALSRVTAPPGRLQRVAMDGPAVYVDYAHSPAALESVLNALRAHCTGRLWCVFGCGGDRDAGKRPQMGKAAEECSDRVIVTSDNPRSEDPAAIIQDVMAGFEYPDAAVAIEDRATAIAWTLAQAAEDDVVLVAGKGHEAYQEANGERVPFSDYEVAQQALAAKGGER